MRKQDLKHNKWNKLIYKVKWLYIRTIKIFSESRYIYLYHKLLHCYGMNIELDSGYIDPTVYFDNYDYSIITIGKNVTISKEVLMLTHDFSINCALNSFDKNKTGGVFFIPYFYRK